MAGSATAPVDWRVPSAVRSFEIYPGGARPGQGLVGPNALPRWVAKHPLEDNGWWINASKWCADIADTIGQVAYPATLQDPLLVIKATAISADGLWAGIRFEGGTPGMLSKIRIVLTSAVSGVQTAVDALLPIESVDPVEANPPGLATLHGSLATIGGLRFPIPS